MIKLQFKLSFTLVLLLLQSQIKFLLACSSTPGRCTQSTYMPQRPLAKLQPEDLNTAVECDGEEDGVGASYVIKFRVQGRGLTSGPHDKGSDPRRPNTYAKVWVDGSFHDSICMVNGHQNPNYSEEFTVNHYTGKESVVKIEMWSQEMDSSWFSTYPEDNRLGNAIFYPKEMLKTGRVVEAPLWQNEGGYFNTGRVQLSVSSCQKTLMHKSDEL